MPVKKVGTSLSELDQGYKNRDTWQKPLISSSAPPMPKGAFESSKKLHKMPQEKSGDLTAYNQGSFQETQY